MLCLSALATLAVALPPPTPAPTSVTHHQLFDNIRADGAEERALVELEAGDEANNILENTFEISERWRQLLDAIRALDIRGSTGTPHLFAVSGAGQVHAISTSNVATLLTSVRGNNGTDSTNSVGADVGPLSSLFVGISSDPAVFSLDAGDLYKLQLNGTLGNVTGQVRLCNDTLGEWADVDGMAFDFTTGRVIGTSRALNDLEGNSCRFVTATVTTPGDAQPCQPKYEYPFPYNDKINTALPPTITDADVEVKQETELCKLPGLAFAPKRIGAEHEDARTLFAVTYWCEIVRLTDGAILDNADAGTGSRPSSEDILRDLRDDQPDAFPKEYRCKRSGLAYDCLKNELHLIYHPTFDTPSVMHAVIDPDTGAVKSNDPIVGLPIAPGLDNDADPRLGYGLASVNCYRMHFIRKEIQRRFGEIRQLTWDKSQELMEIINDGYELISQTSANETNATIAKIQFEANATRFLLDNVTDPLLEFLERIRDVLNATVYPINDAFAGIQQSGPQIALLGPQVQYWIDHFEGAEAFVNDFTHDGMTESRETLLETLTRMRRDVEFRHKAIMDASRELKDCVFEAGQDISVQLQRLQAAYSDNNRWNDDDDDDLGYGSSDFLNSGRSE